jgi:hypothetical protein
MHLLTVVLAAMLVAAAPATPWRTLAPGLDHAVFDVDGVAVEVLRIDPERWQTVALAVSDVGGASRTMAEWADEFDLTAVINAGMFASDRRTHTGYFHTGDHVNNPRWVQRDYRQAACFEPLESGLPRFRLQDLDARPESTFVDQYGIVIQNIRLIRRPGENRWSPSSRRWPEACLAEDARGRMLWIACRHYLDMHALNEILLGLPLDIVAAQHLEGGRQAHLWVDSVSTKGKKAYDPALPNVLGIRPRSSE